MLFGLRRDPKSLTLRRAVRDDAAAIWTLVLEHFPDPDGLTGTEVPVLALQLEKAVALGWVLTTGRKIAAATVIRPEECYVWMLYVTRRWQGHGLGRQLLEHALDHLRGRPCREATLRVPTGAPAEAFYQHLGWRPLHPTRTGTHRVYAITLSRPDGNTDP